MQLQAPRNLVARQLYTAEQSSLHVSCANVASCEQATAAETTPHLILAQDTAQKKWRIANAEQRE
jgi:hypothetical protein